MSATSTLAPAEREILARARTENFPVAFVCSVAEHRLTHMRAYFDVATLMQQIGAQG